LSAANKKLDAQNDRLNKENLALNQKISNLNLDKDSQRARLSDLEGSLKSRDGQVQENNLIIKTLQDELSDFKNEVARLSGTEALLNDRYSMSKTENEANKEKIRSLNIENDAMRAEIESLRQISNDMKFEVARKDEQSSSLNILNSQLKRDLQELERTNENLRLSESAMKGELSALRSELTSLGIEESRISSEIAGLRDANDLLQSKAKTLESENNGLQNAIDLMRSELVDMNTNEKGLVSRVRDIDAQNKALLDEASSLQNETSFFKDKSRQFEIQLNQAIGNERVLNENLASLEFENSKLKAELSRLSQYGIREYENLVLQVQKLQSQIASISGQEQMLQSKLATLENENYRLSEEVLNSKNREQEYSRQLSLLNEDNNRLIDQIESTQRMRLRLRNEIIGVIDQNDQTPSNR
jgi:chromosome segregation ATPase